MADTNASAGENTERSCGECSFCCKILAVAAIDKPAGEWCPHCRPPKGCGIYIDRPEVCRTFYCQYRIDSTVAEDWYPPKSRMMLVLDLDGRRLRVHVDPHRPDAWKREPYHSMLRGYAKNLIPDRGQVLVKVVNRRIAILPDRDVDLGTIAGEFVVNYTPRFESQGVRWDVSVKNL
jgi:hypothetical protein